MTPAWFNLVAMSALGWRTSLEATYETARLAIHQDVPGDFVECGVYAGAQAAIMAKAILEPEHYWDVNRRDNTRRVHLYDSFCGIPAPDQHDVEFTIAGVKAGASPCSLEDVKRNMASWGIPDELLVYHPGYFAETVPSHDGAIAVLRLDGDLYSSTKTCLKHLYPLVSTGGYVIVDDFNLSGCRKALVEYFELAGPAPIYFRKHE